MMNLRFAKFLSVAALVSLLTINTEAQPPQIKSEQPDRILFVTSQSKELVQTFTVASLTKMIQSQYVIDSVTVTRTKASGAALAIGVHIFALAITGPTGSLTVGGSPDIPKMSDKYGVSFVVTRDQIPHEVHCVLKFEDREPIGKVQLRGCRSKTADFESIEQSFESVGLKTTRRSKQVIEKRN